MHTRIYLVGYMASGKTTLGAQLAPLLGYSFHDLDVLVESETGKTIPEIFETEGDAGFRKKEQETLHKTFALNKVVIACGGGTPCYFDNMKAINSNGLSIWLHTPLIEIISRLQVEKHTRPLLAGIPQNRLSETITAQYHTREPFYRQSAIVFHPKQDTLLNLVQFIKTIKKA